MMRVIAATVVLAFLTAGCAAPEGTLETGADAVASAAAKEGLMSYRNAGAPLDPAGWTLPEATMQLRPAAADGCDAVLQFGSHAVGIDPALARRVEDEVLRPADIAVTQVTLGREGDRRYCLTLRDEAERDALARRVAGLLAETPPVKGWVRLDIHGKTVAKSAAEAEAGGKPSPRAFL